MAPRSVCVSLVPLGERITNILAVYLWYVSLCQPLLLSFWVILASMLSEC